MLKTKDGYAKVIGTSYQGSSDYLLLSNGDSKAISSLSVNYANSAGNADTTDGVHIDWSTNYTKGNYLAIWDNKGDCIRPIPLGSVSVGYATNSGNANTLDGAHLSGIFTAFGNNEHNITATIGGVTRKFQVNYASDADKVDGYHVNTGQAPYGHIPTIRGDGVMEIGKYIDFHNDNGGKYDYSTRLQSTGDHQNALNLPSKSGTLALTSDIPTIPTIPNPIDYYWANNKVSNKYTTDAIVQVNSIGAGCATVFGSQQDGTVAATNWFRAVGKTGIYFQTYTGGLYMTDTSWVRTFNNKGLCIKNTVKSNDLQVMYKDDETVATSAAVLANATTLVYGISTSSNSINTYLRGQNITLQVKKDTSINYNAFQVTADHICCNNYCNMKVGATVSDGNFTVQNNSYLAQKAGAKVGIGTRIPSSTLDVKGMDEVPIRVNGGIMLSTKEIDLYMGSTIYYTQPVCIAVGKYMSWEKRITCSDHISAYTISDHNIFRIFFNSTLLEEISDMWVFPIIYTQTNLGWDYTQSVTLTGGFQLDIRWSTMIPDFTFMIYRSPFNMYKSSVREY